MRIRSTFTAGATLGAVAVLTAGCLSEGGSGGGGSSNTSNTIEVMYAFVRRAGGRLPGRGRGLGRGERRHRRVLPDRQLQPADQHPRPGQRRAGRRAVPAAGHHARSWPSRTCSSTSPTSSTQADRDAHDPRLRVAAGEVNDGLYAVPMSVNIKSIVFYPKTAAGGRGPHRAAGDVRGTAGADRGDRCHGHDALVLRDRVRGGHRMAGDGLGREPDADQLRHRYLQRLGQPRDPVQRPAGARGPGADRGSCCWRTAGRTAAGSRSPAATSTPRRTRCSTSRRGATCTGRATSCATPGNFPDEVIEDIDNRVGVFPMPGLTPEDKPVLGGGDMAGVFSKDNEAAQGLVAFLASPEFGTNGYAENGTWFSPRSDFDTSLYANETPDPSPTSPTNHRVRLRRLRPDARRGRFRVPSGGR